MGCILLGVCFLELLGIGTTIAFFHNSGNIPLSTQWLRKHVNNGTIHYKHSFRSLEPMFGIPEDFFMSNF